MSHPTSTFHPMTSGYADLERFDHDEREPGARHLSVLQKGRERQIAMIAHEMRNSLAVIRAATKLLKADGAGSLEGARSLIERHAGQMGRHLEELVDRRGAVRE